MEDVLTFELKALVPVSDQGIVYTCYLFNKQEKLLLPITTNKTSCEFIMLAKQQTPVIRPVVHDTLRRSLLALGGSITEVLIYKFLDEVFYAYLCIKDRKDALWEIDVKTTDAICLAIMCNIPIKVSEDVYIKAGIKITRELLERSIQV